MMLNLDRTPQEQYGIDFAEKMAEILPYFFGEGIQSQTKKQMFVDLCECLFGSMQYSNDEFVAFVTFIRDRLAYTGQVLSLVQLLNDKFDPGLRRITINCLNNNFVEGIDIYLNGETDPTPITLYNNGENVVGPITLWTNAEIFDPDSLYGKSFVVNVPNDVPQSDKIIKGLLNLYVIAPQNYDILRF